VDVVDLNNEKVGERELAEEVFAARNEALLYEAVRWHLAGERSGTARPRRGTKWRARAKSCGSRRARAGRAWAPSVARSGGTGTSHGPVPRDYSYALPAQDAVGRAALALTPSCRDGG